MSLNLMGDVGWFNSVGRFRVLNYRKLNLARLLCRAPRTSSGERPHELKLLGREFP